MTAPLQNFENGKTELFPTVEKSSDRPRVNFFTIWTDEDPFTGPYLLELIYKEKHEEIRTAVKVKGMLQLAAKNCMQTFQQTKFTAVFSDHINIFRTGFSTGASADILSFRIVLSEDEKTNQGSYS